MSFARVYYTPNGGTDYAVPFSYQSKTEVKVEVGGIANTTFTWLNDSTIRFSAAPTLTVLIYRDTGKSANKVVAANNTVIYANDFNTENTQLLYGIDEAYDLGSEALGIDHSDGVNLTARSKRIKYVKDAVDPQDAVNKQTASSLITAAIQPIAQLASLNTQLQVSGVDIGGVTPLAFGASGSSASTTGSITSGSPLLTLAAVGDFKVGQNVLVNHAGAAFSQLAPSALTVTPIGTAGTTTYAYRVAPVDYAGGIGTALAAVQTTTGNATLTADNYVQVQFNTPSYLTGAPAFVIWRSVNGGAYIYHSSVCNTAGTTVTFKDVGQLSHDKPFWVPQLPTDAPLAQWLIKTINTIVGNVATLNGNAGTTVASEIVVHDDSAAFSAWVTYLNAQSAGGAMPEGTVYRLTSLPPQITNPRVHIRGARGVIIYPAGAVSLTALGQAIFDFAGGGLGTGIGLTGVLSENNTAVALTDTASFTAGGYAYFNQPAPNPGAGNAGNYSFISPIKKILSSTGVTLLDPAPIAFTGTSEYIVLGGSVVAGDTFSVTATGAFTGSPLTVNITVQPYDTFNTLAKRVAAGFLSNANFGASGATCIARGNLVIVSSSLTYTWSRTNGTSATVTLSAGDTATAYPVTLLDNVGVSGVTANAVNVVGQDGNGFHFIRLQYCSHAIVENIIGSNFIGGAVVHGRYGYGNTYRTIKAIKSANSFWADTYIADESHVDAWDIMSDHPNGFGWQLNGCSRVKAGMLHSSGAQAGRGSKIANSCHFALFGISGDNSESTGFAIAVGCYRGHIFGGSFCGNVNAINNSEGIWFNNQYNNFIELHGITTVGNKQYDIYIGENDTDNLFYGTVANILYNGGRALFYGLHQSIGNYDIQDWMLAGGYDSANNGVPIPIIRMGQGHIGITPTYSKSRFAATEGFSVAAADGVERLIITGANLTAGTITLPPNPIDGQDFRVCPNNSVTGITWAAGGRTIGNAPAGLTGGVPVGWTYDKAQNTWYRVQ